MAKGRWYSSRYFLLVFILIVVGGGIGAWEFFSKKTENLNYIFGTIDRGDVITQVQMTGTLAAVTTVAVGTQVSGTVSELHADFNSAVKKGQVLAKLDPALFQTQLDQADASVKAAMAVLNNDVASIANVKANLEKAKVDTLNSNRKFKMVKELFDEGLETKDDMESAQATLDSSKASQVAVEAQLDASQSALKADQARLDQAQANLKNAQVNLDHCTITSPISGTVISRNVDNGQTVAASFSTPTMFTIGEDLTKMQVITNTDEADVGKLKPGMDATFTVDAFPGETFHGAIQQVRLSATTVQNVVTYNAVINVSNPDLKLNPGMTANVKIIIEKVENSLRLPNAAIRFRPELSDIDMENAFKRAGEEKFYSFYRNQGNRNRSGSQTRAASGSSGNANAARAGNRSDTGTSRGGQASGGTNNRGRRTPVWIIGEDKLVRPVLVRLGLTDGVATEIVEGKLKEGDKIILSVEMSGNRSTSTTPARGATPGFGGGLMGGRGMR